MYRNRLATQLHVRASSVFGIVIVASLASAPVAIGQVEVIARVEESAEVSNRLERFSKTDMETSDPLFRSVTSVRSLFETSSSLGKTQERPFAAYVLTVRDSVGLRDALDTWSSQSGVLYVQQNYRYRIDDHPAADDPLADSLYHFDVIGARQAWTASRGSPEVVVGLVDTGVHFDHPDLAGQFFVSSEEDIDGDGRLSAFDLDGIDNDGNGYTDDVSGFDFVDRPQTVEPGDYVAPDPFADADGSEHGTNVAGIVGASQANGEGIAGIAPGVRLLSLRAFGRDGRGDDDDIAQAIVYAALNGVDVLNLSFGDVFASPLMHEAIRYAVERGVVIVASAGNEGGDGPHYPSDYPEVISVAWLTGDGQSLAPRATSGVGVDIGAPGSSIFTTTIPAESSEGDTGSFYGRRSGSSMAAPMVAAAAALIRSVDPSLSPASVRSALASSATDIGETGWDHETGAGLLHVARSVFRALPGRVEIVSPAENQGIATDAVTIRGTAVDPSFASYSLWYAAGDTDLRAADWREIVGPQTGQVWNGDLGRWEVGGLEEGLYTLRLVVRLRTGRTVEDRRRVYVDRTPPKLEVLLVGSGLVDGYHGILSDVKTDDVSALRMDIDLSGILHTTVSDRRARRHGLFWADMALEGGRAEVVISAANMAGLRSDTSFVLDIPRRRVNSALMESSSASAPHGFLLDRLADFDGDGLHEIVMNVYEDGWIGDTLAFFEWGGDGFRRAAAVTAGVIPRDVGDADGDGLLEVLAQVGAATILLEQAPGSYPQSIAFIDTTGLSGNQTEALWGARLGDLDGDGRGEIIGHNTRQWRILEHTGSTFEEVLRVDNPTDVSSSELGENTFEQPYTIIGDLDEDGRQDMLTGDSDGDLVVFESTGDNALVGAWVNVTERYDAGSRMAAADLNGDGRREIVAYDHNWLTTTFDGQREPDIGRYSIFTNDGDDSYALAHTFLSAGEITRHGSLATMDVDGDGVDDLVIVNPPDLYVLSFDLGLDPSLVFHMGRDEPAGFSGFRSVRMVVGDVDGDGAQELVAADAEGSLRVLRLRSMGELRPAVQWLDASAIDNQTVRLSWLPSAADSVTVYRAGSGSSFEQVGATVQSVFVDTVDVRSDYMLRGWYGGDGGSLSRVRSVRPHPPARVVSLERPGPRRVELTFSESLQANTSARQFALDLGGEAKSLLLAREARTLVLEFARAVEAADTLRWSAVRDSEGTAVADSSLAISAFEGDDASLVVESWQVLSPTSVNIVFSDPLDPVAATSPGNYVVSPAGRVESATLGAGSPREVEIRLSGAVAGATGLSTTVTVIGLTSVDGKVLAPEGATLQLSEPAPDLAGVFVFPNPYRTSRMQEGLMIAGLPPEASVRIFSGDGVLLRTLDETDADGGIRWDVRDEGGLRVPSGIYLILVTTEGQQSVLKKAAVIQ